MHKTQGQERTASLRMSLPSECQRSNQVQGPTGLGIPMPSISPMTARRARGPGSRGPRFKPAHNCL